MLHVAPLGFLSFPTGGYVPAGAIWLDGSADYLTWTPSSGSSNTAFTFSFWTKRAGLGAYGAVLAGTTTAAQSDFIRFGTSNTFETIGDDGNDWTVVTSAVYRDTTAWEHWVVSFNNTTDVRIWNDGVEITSFSTNTESGTMGGWLRATAQYVGRNGAGQYFNGYLAEVIALDGTAVTDALDFGEFDTKGNWVPKDPTGLTFGTNGFWLDFADSSNLGKRAEREAAPGNTTLLIHSNTTDGSTTFVDSALGATITANGNIQHDDAQAKFGTTSIYSASSSDYLTIPDSPNLTFGSNDFTIAFWYRNNGAYGSSIGWMDKLQGAAAREWTFGIQTSNIMFQFSTDGTANWHNMFTYAHSLSADTWHHIAVTRNGSNWYLFIDGTLVATDTDSASIYNSTAVVRLCSDDVGGYNGWVDELLIVNGTAVWTTSFDVPTAAYDELDFKSVSMSAANSTSDRPADKAADDLGNYATWSPISKAGMTSNATFSEGNMRASSGATGCNVQTTIAVGSGKWYCEFLVNSAGSNYPLLGVSDPSIDENGWIWVGAGVRSGDGYKTDFPFDSSDPYGAAYTSGTDVVMCAMDLDNGAVWMGLNGTWWNSATASEIAAGTTTNALSTTAEWAALGDGTPLCFGAGLYTADVTLRTKESDWSYSAPTGFKALATYNLPAPTVKKPDDYFKTVLYTGNGGTQAITGVGFQPDLVWLKCRSAAYNHQLMDAVRGASVVLASNLPDAESTSETDSFGSDGFTLTHNASIGRANVSGQTFVAWCLKANGSGVSNSIGDIASTVSAAAHGGFSIGTYTMGTSAATGYTIGHGLSTTPDLIIDKVKSAGPSDWHIYSKDTTTPAARYLYLNDSVNEQISTTIWNNTQPSPTVYSVSTSFWGTDGYSHVFYAFARTPGLIGIGKYVGNGDPGGDGPYVVVDDGGSGFRPAFLLVKRIDTTGYDWQVVDAVRDTYNPVNKNLSANLTAVEGSGLNVDFTANGFKWRVASNSVNASGGTYIYLAFAEYPFGGEGVAQAKAR